jgi:hypothetical protein
MTLTAPERSILGDLLWGNNLMRFVYMDEAGTSEHEPVTVVVALIVNADEQLMMAEKAIDEALGAVPEKYREGFAFHAKDVWGNTAYREDWPLASRMHLLHTMMRLPRRLRIPVAMSMIRRSSEPIQPLLDMGLTLAQSQHVMAFIYCIGQADRYIREHADLKEIGSIIAEDVPEIRKHLKLAPKAVKIMNAPIGTVIPTAKEREQGFVTQRAELRVTRIRNSVHFVKKGDDPLLQLSDACAFGLRRLFSEQDFGKEFGMSIKGVETNLEDFSGPASLDLFLGPAI